MAASASQPYILMLENDSDDKYFTESTVEELGLDIPITFALFSEELVESLSDGNTPALILLSYSTFPVEGLEILRTIKSSPNTAHVPVIVLTEDLAARSIRDYYRAGANTVIKKPHSVQLTVSKIRTFFEYWLNVAEV